MADAIQTRRQIREVPTSRHGVAQTPQ